MFSRTASDEDDVEKVTGTFCTEDPKGLSGKRCLSPFPLSPVPPGRFLVADVYQGLPGVKRGTIKRLRILEETARTSGIPPGGRWWNQAFLVSWQGAYIVKNILGTVPVREDGSAYFEVPPGRAVYFEALDEEGREVQRMRTYVQALPGVTRSCIGCHEDKKSAAVGARPPLAMLAQPAKPEPESWGSGFVDYPTMVQPILDKHCVRCHDQPTPPKYAAKPTRTPGPPAEVRPAFSLKAQQTLDAKAQRKWSDSYRALADRRACSWINVQSAPPMLPPYHAGASQSKLIALLEEGSHYGVKLSQPELDRFIVWIDLLVPYVGDYTEAMPEDKIPRYNHFLEKRRRWQAEEARNIADYLGQR